MRILAPLGEIILNIELDASHYLYNIHFMVHTRSCVMSTNRPYTKETLYKITERSIVGVIRYSFRYRFCTFYGP